MDPATRTAGSPAPTSTREQQPPSSDSDPGRRRKRLLVVGCLGAAVVAAVSGALLVAGGADKPEVRPAQPPPPVTASPTPSATVSRPPRPEDLAVAAAKAKYLEYVRVHDRVGQGGYKNLKLYDAVAVSPERAELALEAARSAGIRTTGSSKVVALGVQSVELTTNSHRSFSQVGLTGCLDVRGVKAYNADGSSAVVATRLPRIAFTALVQMVPASALSDSGRPGGWYVTKVTYPGGGTAC